MKDQDFKEISNLKWLPWIGVNYLTTPFKILIVGESHYAEDNEDRIKEFDRPETTRECIVDMGVENNTYGVVKFYQNIQYLLVGNKNFSTEELWSRVSFYNFIQKTMITSKTRPEYLDYHNSAGVFFKLLEKLEPKYCLMCGVSSINALKNTIQDSSFTEISFDKFDKIGSIYPRIMTIKSKQDKIINLIFIQHPSHHFSYDNWKEFLINKSPELLNQFNDL
jgi:hypothetical protein